MSGYHLKLNRSSLPLAAFCACGMIWGSTFLAIGLGNDAGIPAVWACALRLGLATLILNAVLFARGQTWPKGEALRAACWYGFYEFGVSLPLLYWGEKVVPTGLAAVLYAICPVVAMFEARALRMEQLNYRRLGAAALAFLGVGVIFWDKLIQGSSPLSLLSVFAAAVSAPLAGLVLQRGPKQSAVGSNAVGALVGFPICIAISFLLREQHPLPSTLPSVFPVVYLAVVGSVGAFVIFAWLVQHWKATTVAFLGVIVPVIAVILGSIVRHESFAPTSLAGAAIVIFGVTIALRSEVGQPVPSLPQET